MKSSRRESEQMMKDELRDLLSSEKVSSFIIDKYLSCLSNEDENVGYLPYTITKRCQSIKRSKDLYLISDIRYHCSGKKRIFAPLNINDHWILLDITPVSHTINIYNSQETKEVNDNLIRSIGITLEFQLPLEYNNLNHIQQNCAQQKDDSISSGVFLLMNAFCLTKGEMLMDCESIEKKGREIIYNFITQTTNDTKPQERNRIKRRSLRRRNSLKKSGDNSNNDTSDRNEPQKIIFKRRIRETSPPTLSDFVEENPPIKKNSFTKRR